jgi:histidine phosphotransfer protein HptB
MIHALAPIAGCEGRQLCDLAGDVVLDRHAQPARRRLNLPAIVVVSQIRVDDSHFRCSSQESPNDSVAGNPQSGRTSVTQGEASRRDEPDLDLATVARLRQLRSAKYPRFFQAAVETYAAAAEHDLTAIRVAGQRRDQLELSQRAHALKGGSSSIGAALVSQLCQQLENRARAGEAMAASGLIHEIEIALGRALLKLRELAAATAEGG